MSAGVTFLLQGKQCFAQIASSAAVRRDQTNRRDERSVQRQSLPVRSQGAQKLQLSVLHVWAAKGKVGSEPGVTWGIKALLSGG